MRISFISIILIVILFFSNSRAQIFFIEQKFDPILYRPKLIKITENNIEDYDLPCDYVFNWDFIDNNTLLFNVIVGEQLLFMKFEPDIKNFNYFSIKKSKGIISFCTYQNIIYIAECEAEQLRLDSSSLYLYDDSTKELSKLSTDPKLNFDNLAISGDGSFLSFLHINAIEKNEEDFKQYLALYNLNALS